VSKAEKLTAIFEPIVWKMWEPQPLTTAWTTSACYRDNCTLQIMKINTTQFSPASCYVLPLRSQYSAHQPILEHPKYGKLPHEGRFQKQNLYIFTVPLRLCFISSLTDEMIMQWN
jgi:hypothetical protein